MSLKDKNLIYKHCSHFYHKKRFSRCRDFKALECPDTLLAKNDIVTYRGQLFTQCQENMFRFKTITTEQQRIERNKKNY